MLDGMDGTTMANASVTNILSQIATVEREIINPVSGSAIYAYDEIPYTISTADMPLFVNFPGQLLSNEKLAGYEAGQQKFGEATGATTQVASVLNPTGGASAATESTTTTSSVLL